MIIPMQYLNIKGKTNDKPLEFVIDDPFAEGFGGVSGTNVTKLSQLENDTGFITKTVADLTNYYDKTAVDNKLSAVPKFSIAVVQSLPTDNISATTVYLLPSEQGENNVYEEYLYVNGEWEKLGSQKVDLTDYYTKSEINGLLVNIKIPTKMSELDNDTGYAKKTDIPTSLPASDVPDWAKQPNKPTYSKSDVGLGNVDNVRQYSESNPPPYPVTSVNGKTGAVEVEPKGMSAERVAAHNTQSTAHQDIRQAIADIKVPTKVSELSNDAGYMKSTEQQSVIDNALAQAKASGEFDGEDGVSATHSWNGTTLTVTSASGTSSADLKGEKGDAYALTSADKSSIASAVKASLTTETWTFTLADGSTVTKAVYIG